MKKGVIDLPENGKSTEKVRDRNREMGGCSCGKGVGSKAETKEKEDGRK